MNIKQRIIELLNKYENPTYFQRTYSYDRQTFLEDFFAAII